MASTETPTNDTIDQAFHHSKYRLRVTAGPAYDITTHKLVKINAPETLTIESEHMVISIAVRIRNFTGFPTSSPQTSPYFTHPLHKSDQYSISFSFIPKVDISGKDLVFGNDFERPIRDRLPPGTNQALKFVKWMIDPGLEGDMYADRPYLYGPALSSWNTFRIGDKIISTTDGDKQAWKMPNSESFHETVVEEGAEGTGSEVRKDLNIPADAATRKKYFLTEANREAFTFEAGRLYQSDFGNPYLDFNDFSLKLPVFTLNVIKYVDAKTHELRYTLKNFASGEVYAVVLFNLLFGEDLRRVEDGSDLVQGETEETEEEPKVRDGVSSPTAARRTEDEEKIGDEPGPSADDVD